MRPFPAMAPIVLLSLTGVVALAAAPAAPTLEQIQSAKVRGVFEGKTVKLKNGKYEGAPFVPGGAERPRVELLDRFTASGNVDDTPVEERVVLLSRSSGGTGVNLYLGVFGLRGGTAENLDTVLVGDRAQPSMLAIGGGMIFLDIVEAGPGDAACCPTQPARKAYRFGSRGLEAVVGVSSASPAAPTPATYRVTLVDIAPPKLTITADVPIDGNALTMDTTRPGGIAELDASGWPSLVANLNVVDATGGAVEATARSASGWKLAAARSGRVRLSYDVDYAALAAAGWPAPRETGLAAAEQLVLPCRSIFVTTAAVKESIVSFELPKGWQSVTPWAPQPKSKNTFAVHDATDLVENLLVLTRTAPDVVTAGGFRLQIVAMGPWQAARKEVRRVLGAVIPRLVALMGAGNEDNYLVVLLPVVEHGGESYRHSFALTFEEPPSRANSAAWGNTIAHEVFHLWNGWKMQGADYPTSQWFQEGFTEYAANLAMVGAKLIDEKQFLKKLTDHVVNYRKLKTTMDAGGTHKGPPLYSAGALVAFTWDVTILAETGGQRGFSDFLRALWKQTEQGGKPYSWPDIRAALDATAPSDWDAFYNAYIRGAEPLPLPRTFASVGVDFIMSDDAAPHLTFDQAAPASAKGLWQALVNGR